MISKDSILILESGGAPDAPYLRRKQPRKASKEKQSSRITRKDKELKRLMRGWEKWEGYEGTEKEDNTYKELPSQVPRWEDSILS